ncbi:MAG: PEP-CTERM/exosortase system-associated acyltransferase [Nitrospirales bacterium]|nr:PEP-CTERM/exosortase system-associated acyltransferase [Nitrospirales bacterium]
MDLEEVFRLRYRVYCEEQGFESSQNYPEGLEYDDFDKNSLHFLSLSNEAQLTGTVRLILNSDKGFPIENNCIIDKPLSIDKDRFGEISRLAVSREFLRRSDFRYRDEALSGWFEEEELQAVSKKHSKDMFCSLYESIYVEAKRSGITHFYAIMAQGLHILLRRLGIIFHSIGPEIDYHGLRAPYVICLEQMEHDLERKNPELLREFTEALNTTPLSLSSRSDSWQFSGAQYSLQTI